MIDKMRSNIKFTACIRRIDVSRVPSVQLWNPWNIMLDLNAGLMVALDVADMERMLSYFTAHGIDKADYKISLLSGGVSTIKKILDARMIDIIC